MAKVNKLPDRGQVGARLDLTRQALGKEPAEFCRLYGLKLNTFSQWISGDRLINLSDAVKLCGAIGVTLDWIYRGEMGALPYELAQRIREQRPANVHPLRGHKFT
jgi:transcriptional regulator with XRE-family HTH domain